MIDRVRYVNCCSITKISGCHSKGCTGIYWTKGRLEYFAETADSANFEKAITHTEVLIIPSIVLYEVFKKIANDFDEDKALFAIVHMKMAKIIELTETIAINAAKTSIEKKIPMANSIIYATAELYDATIRRMNISQNYPGLGISGSCKRISF